jgi:hypothetical protein
MHNQTDHVDQAIRVAVDIARRQAQEMRDIRTCCERRQYDLNFVQRVRHLVGLEPDPQLSDKELFDERQSPAAEKSTPDGQTL